MSGTPLIAAIVAALTLAPAGVAQNCVTEDFEAYQFGAPGTGVNLVGIQVLDENTIANGQGPGLVADGCEYSTTAPQLQWNDAGWFGRTDKDILGNGAPDLTLTYDVPVDTVDFTLDAYSGFSDTATVTALDSGGAVISTQSGIALSGGAPVAVSVVGPDIETILIVGGGAVSWSPLLNDHVFCAGPAGPALSASGVPGGAMTFDLANFTPNSQAAVVYGPAGGYVVPGGSCAGLIVGLQPMNFPPVSSLILLGTDANGDAQLARSVPASGAGLSVQAVDVAGCTASNVIVL